MYDKQNSRSGAARCTALALSTLLTAVLVAQDSSVRAEEYENPSVIRKISGRNEKLELTTNTSRILTLEKNIPRVQVNNPELVAVTPLSAKDVQISAKKAGVTQVNLWDEDGNIHTIDVLIYGDARELTVALQTQFPHSSIRVYRYSESLVLTGFVDRPDHVGPIMRLAEDYAPKVINNINVGGVQQILLKVKVMEISRTKLRQMGMDWAWFGGGGDFAVSRPGGLIAEFASANQSIETLGDTFSFGLIGDSSAFFGVLDALQERQIAKTLAEPNIVAVSGRPAQFQVGGEFPILIPQSLGTTSIEFKPYGTQVDFLPIVLGNGNIRLEVRPRISDIDPTLQVRINDTEIPALTTRQVDTAVEMKAGQTFALAGLVQERTDSFNSGLPYISDVPVLGVPFRKMRNRVNEIELLIVVTPEFVDPLDACETPCTGPGYATTNPTNCQLYCGGRVEVPAHCNPLSGMTICGDDCCQGGYSGIGGGATCGDGAEFRGAVPMTGDGFRLPGGTGYDDSMTITDGSPMGEPETIRPRPMGGEDRPRGAEPMQNVPQDLPLPGENERGDGGGGGALPDEARIPSGPVYQGHAAPPANRELAGASHYLPPRQPVFMRNASRPNNPQPAAAAAGSGPSENGLFGPVGYDLQ